MNAPTTPREMIAHLQRELSVANNWIEHHQNHVDDLIKENAALRADKERLDWIARNRSVSATERPLSVTPESLRASIDALRKDAQP